MTRLVTWDDLKNTVIKQKLKVDLTTLEMAYLLAAEAHAGQSRSSGEPYIHHCLATAKKLAELKLDQDTIVAGLLHDVPEDTNVSLEEIYRDYGQEVTKLVQGITKLGKLKYRGLERYSENLRKMFVAMAADIRVVLIKFADRLHNLATIAALPGVKQQRIATETLDIYAPIADRLGMGEIKGELEDLAFKVLRPDEYEEVKGQVAARLPTLEKHLDHIADVLKDKLKENGVIPLIIQGRRKHLYSLWKKLAQKNKDIKQVYDLIALRVIVPTVEDCYQVLGLIHGLWTPLPGRVKDYIALPKANGYQSLHTTIFDESGEIMEIQIRTPEMHERAEYGIAAHWHYKEVGSAAKIDQERLAWLKDLVEWQKNLDDEQFLNTVKMDIFKNRIFALTPHGDAIDLPEEATVIDFAYAVHTEIGHTCAGARVNGQMVSLNKVLQSGDVVEILTDKNRKKPNADWLAFVKTHGAREKIRSKLKD